MRHLQPGRIASYVSGRLTEQELFRLDEHLAVCPDCARRVRAFRLVRENLDALLDSWSARRASSLELRDQVAGAAEQAEACRGLQERLWSWLEGFPGRTRVVLGVVMEGARRTVEIVDESAERLGRATGFRPVPIPVRVLGEHDRSAASVEDHAHPWARVTADAATGIVAVQLARTAEPWPIAVLITRHGESAMIEEFKPVEGEDYLLATFQDVRDGEYTLLLEDTRPD